LAPFSSTPKPFDTTLIFTILHLESNGFFHFFYKTMNQTRTLNFHLIISTMHSNTCCIYLQAIFLGRFFKYLQNYFHLKDLMSGFPLLFQLCFHIAQGHIPCQITHVFGVVHFLAMTKPLGAICSIAMGEMLYWFISHILCL